jgi:hypothetical protein
MLTAEILEKLMGLLDLKEVSSDFCYLEFLFFLSQCTVSLEVCSQRDVLTVQQTFTTHSGEKSLVMCVKARINQQYFL